MGAGRRVTAHRIRTALCACAAGTLGKARGLAVHRHAASRPSTVLTHLKLGVAEGGGTGRAVCGGALSRKCLRVVGSLASSLASLAPNPLREKPLRVFLSSVSAPTRASSRAHPHSQTHHTTHKCRSHPASAPPRVRRARRARGSWPKFGKCVWSRSSTRSASESTHCVGTHGVRGGGEREEGGLGATCGARAENQPTQCRRPPRRASCCTLSPPPGATRTECW